MRKCKYTGCYQHTRETKSGCMRYEKDALYQCPTIRIDSMQKRIDARDNCIKELLEVLDNNDFGWRIRQNLYKKHNKAIADADNEASK